MKRFFTGSDNNSKEAAARPEPSGAPSAFLGKLLLYYPLRKPFLSAFYARRFPIPLCRSFLFTKKAQKE